MGAVNQGKIQVRLYKWEYEDEVNEFGYYPKKEKYIGCYYTDRFKDTLNALILLREKEETVYFEENEEDFSDIPHWSIKNKDLPYESIIEDVCVTFNPYHEPSIFVYVC